MPESPKCLKCNRELHPASPNFTVKRGFSLKPGEKVYNCWSYRPYGGCGMMWCVKGGEVTRNYTIVHSEFIRKKFKPHACLEEVQAFWERDGYDQFIAWNDFRFSYLATMQALGEEKPYRPRSPKRDCELQNQLFD